MYYRIYQKLFGAVWIWRSVRRSECKVRVERGLATYIGIFIDLSWKPFLPWLKGFGALNASCTSISNAIFEVYVRFDKCLVSSSSIFKIYWLMLVMDHEPKCQRWRIVRAIKSQIFFVRYQVVNFNIKTAFFPAFGAGLILFLKM